jgi:hypothetical protein
VVAGEAVREIFESSNLVAPLSFVHCSAEAPFVLELGASDMFDEEISLELRV